MDMLRGKQQSAGGKVSEKSSKTDKGDKSLHLSLGAETVKIKSVFSSLNLS
jgi:hypothetical protein